MIQPLVDGFKQGTAELRLEPNDVPAARAVVISMWTEARRQWEASLTPTSQTTGHTPALDGRDPHTTRSTGLEDAEDIPTMGLEGRRVQRHPHQRPAAPLP